jgi:tetratricopeptide (TPR) repeat protein
MHRFAGFFLVILIAFVLDVPAHGQHIAADDPPKLLEANRADVQAQKRRSALYRFVEGCACVREDRLIEALKAFEDAVALDPEPAAPYKAQLPLLIALDRPSDAVAVCNKVFQRHPDDFEICAVLGRLHKAMAHDAEARRVLKLGLKAPGLDERPELAQQMNFDLGALYEADGQLVAAADAYTKAAILLDHPDVIAEHAGIGKDLVVQRAAEIYERIGDLYCRAKEYDRAVAGYVKAQERAPMRAERLNYNLAQVCQAQGDVPRALGYIDAYLRTQPIGMEAYEMKIALLRSIEKEAGIVPWLEQAAKADEFNVGLRLLLARECGKAKQTARAETLYRSLAETSPTAELYRGLLRLYLDDGGRMVATVDQTLGRTARKKATDANAVARARAIVGALREDSELARTVVTNACRVIAKGAPLGLETLQVLAVFADKNGQLAEAERLYRSCLQQITPEAETMVYGSLIRVLGKARKFAAQVVVCDGALSGNAEQGLPKAQATSQVLFLTEKARALAGLRRHAEAIEAADRALRVAGENNRLLVQHLRVRLLTMADRLDEAAKECEALLAQSRQPAERLEIRYLLSNVYSQAKQMAKSEEQLKLILEVDPDNPTANNDLGYLWADQNKNLVEAEQMIRRAIAADRRQRSVNAAPALPGEPPPPSPVVPAGIMPAGAVEVEDNAAFVDSLGWVLYRRGQVEQARQELERAARLPEGEDPVIWEHLGEVYWALHLNADARRAWQHAVHLYDQGDRRKDDDRMKQLERKLQSLPQSPGSR